MKLVRPRAKIDPSYSQMRFYNINYLATLDLIMTWHRIYKERDETSFIWMKPVQLIFNVLKTV
jgi:hypothetical protein